MYCSYSVQELALKKNTKKKQCFLGRKKQRSSIVEEEVEAAVCSAEAEEKEKKVKEEKKLSFWSKKKQRHSIVEEEVEAAVCSAEAGQEEEGKEAKERRQGFWSLARKERSSHSDNKVVESSAYQAGQQ